jgi:hypothetical protein
MAHRRDEQPTNLEFWFGDGHAGWFEARVRASTKVSIGRTNSKRALGFIVIRGKTTIDFTLDKDQVAELAAYLKHCALERLLKPLGRKRSQWSLVAMSSPKHRLHMRLENAASELHPGYHDGGEGMVEIEDGAPTGKALIAWFKKVHPKKAARIEREFSKELWEGR